MTISGRGPASSLEQWGQPFGDPFRNEQMALRAGMYSINGEVVVAEDIVHEVGNEQCAVPFAYLFVAGQILVAENPYSQLEHRDHRAVIYDAPDYAVKIVKCFLPVDPLAKIVPAEFHNHQKRIVREHVPIESGKPIPRRIAFDTGIENLYTQPFSDKRRKSLAAADTMAGRDAVSETDDYASLRIEICNLVDRIGAGKHKKERKQGNTTYKGEIRA